MHPKELLRVEVAGECENLTKYFSLLFSTKTQAKDFVETYAHQNLNSQLVVYADKTY